MPVPNISPAGRRGTIQIVVRLSLGRRGVATAVPQRVPAAVVPEAVAGSPLPCPRAPPRSTRVPDPGKIPSTTGGLTVPSTSITPNPSSWPQASSPAGLLLKTAMPPQQWHPHKNKISPAWWGDCAPPIGKCDSQRDTPMGRYCRGCCGDGKRQTGGCHHYEPWSPRYDSERLADAGNAVSGRRCSWPVPMSGQDHRVSSFSVASAFDGFGSLVPRSWLCTRCVGTTSRTSDASGATPGGTTKVWRLDKYICGYKCL